MKTLNDKWLVEAFTEEYPELAHNLMTDVEQMISKLVNKYIKLRNINHLLDEKTISDAKRIIKTSIRRVIATELLSNELKGETLNTF